MNTPDSLNPALQKAHEAGNAANAEHQKAKAALEVALGGAIKSINNLLLAERDRLFASGESAAEVSYSLVIRDGTRGKLRETLEMILRAVAPFATKDEAVQAKGRVREDLRPFVSISRYTGMVQR